MQKIVDKILAQKSEYQYEIKSIDECIRIGEKIKNIVTPSFRQDLPILKISELLKIYFYLYIPKEKWFLISEIMDELGTYIDEKPEIFWFQLFYGLESLDREILDNYIYGIEEFLKEGNIKSIISVDADSFIKKHRKDKDGVSSYDLNVVLAVLVKNNFMNAFENMQDFQKKNTTEDGIHRLFSFLILFSIAFDGIKEDSVYFKGFLGCITKFNSSINQFNSMCRQNKIKVNKVGNEPGKFVVNCNTNDSKIVQLAKDFNEYHELWSKMAPAYNLVLMCDENKRIFSSRQKELYTQISYLKDILQALMKKEEFYSLSPSITKLENKNLQKQILLKIQEVNLANEKKWNRKLKHYQKNDFEQLCALLNKYHCHPETLSDSEKQQITSLCSLEKIKQIILALENSTFDWKPFYFQILTTTSVIRVSKIDYYLKRKILTTKILGEHIEYFDIHSDSFDQFERNFNLLESKGISGKDVSKKTFSIFLNDSSQLERRLDLHEFYQTSFQKNDTNHYDYLLDDQSFDLYDEFIELGFLNYMRKNPYLLVKSNQSVGGRIRLMREIGYKIEEEIPSYCFTEDIFSGSDISQYFEDDYGFVTDDILENNQRLTISPSTLSMSIVRDMDSKYLVCDSIYAIEGIPISRNRFLRNLEVLNRDINLSDSEKISRAILYTPYAGYTKEEIDILKNKFMTGKSKMIGVK